MTTGHRWRTVMPDGDVECARCGQAYIVAVDTDCPVAATVIARRTGALLAITAGIIWALETIGISLCDGPTC